MGNPRGNCLKDIPESDPEPFSLCGDHVVEGDEECDCGLHYETCSDPCCYAAHISASDLDANATATPCRTNRKHICLQPWDATWQFGFVAPWIFIAVVTLALAVGLVWDWKHDKVLYDHVTKPSEMIRSETAEQMAKRLQRQGLRGEKIYVIKDVEANRTSLERNGVGNGEALLRGNNAVPEEPKPGIVQQLKSQLEKKA